MVCCASVVRVLYGVMCQCGEGALWCVVPVW